MSRIRSRDTKPELRVRSLVHRLGYRFRLQAKQLTGKPDLVLPRYRTAVFVHGCFWHRHPGCRFAYHPRSRVEFWQTKFARNVERDEEVRTALEAEGWQVVVIWECETTTEDQLREVLLERLPPRDPA